MLRQFLKRLFCRHEFEPTGSFYEEMEAGVRYSVRHYICQKCGKEIWIDGRIDRK